jgi:hypothetical protein
MSIEWYLVPGAPPVPDRTLPARQSQVISDAALAPDDARPIPEAIMATHEFKRTIVDRIYEQGKAAYLLRALKSRGLEPSEEQLEQIASCADEAQLDRWFDRAMTATSVAEVFAD